MENPSIHRKRAGIFLWQNDLKGNAPFAYQWHMGHPWNDYDDIDYRGDYYTYPTSTGALSTLQFEAVREAITDLQYLAAWQDAIQAAPDSPTKTQAQQFVDALHAAEDFDPDSIRAGMVRTIEQLSGLPASSQPKAGLGG